ncbi:hypothetical protein HYX58_02430 [Candidatus Dependentiae bacterium]|nr:hypothetical protein [Candidatus Dependentiae bacterium]
MKKFILIVALLSISVIRAVDDERTFEKGVKKAREFFQNAFKENSKKDLPKSSDVKPMGQTRPMPIVLQKEEKPAIIIEEKKEIKNELPQIEKEAKKIEQEKQSTTEKIKSAIVNNPRRIAAAVLIAGFFWMIWNADSSGGESSK